MGTRIEWTDETWNPMVGCSKAGAGCDNCYAIGAVHRNLTPAHTGLTWHTGGSVDWTGEVRLLPTRLDQPLRWTRPRRIFVNSLSDLFHPEVPTIYIAKVFAIMALAPQHTFQVLTKRPQRMAAILNHPNFDGMIQHTIQEMLVDPDDIGYGPHVKAAIPRSASGWDVPKLPLANVWLGVSVDNDASTFRVDHLRDTPAAIRWVSAEPLLGPLPSLDLTDIDWLVVGGESGPGARPMHPNWVRELRDRCHTPAPEVTDGHLDAPDSAIIATDDGTGRIIERVGDEWVVKRRCAFLFKQWGSWVPRGRLRDGEPLPVDNDHTIILNEAGNTRGKAAGSLSNRLGEFSDGSHCEVMERVRKSESGRTLDGRIEDEYPSPRPAELAGI